MKRWNLAINFFLFCSGLLAVGTAILLHWRLPHGRDGATYTFLGWDRHQWGEVHWWLGLLLVIGVVVHLALHWRWIWKIAISQRKIGLWIGLAVVAAVVAFFTLVPVEPISGTGHGPGQGTGVYGAVEAGDPRGAMNPSSGRGGGRGKGFRQAEGALNPDPAGAQPAGRGRGRAG